ncbi:MAG: hypothetical protein QM759_16785 [Terricaulis sp.]
MADVVFVCVRDDMDRAEALAEMFAAGGCSVHEGTLNNAALCLAGAAVVVWSKLATKSKSFLSAAEKAIEEGKAVFVCFSEPPQGIDEVPWFDLREWDGDAKSELLNPLFFAVDHLASHNRDDLAAEDAVGLPMAEGWTADLPSTPLTDAKPPAPRLLSLEPESADALAF